MVFNTGGGDGLDGCEMPKEAAVGEDIGEAMLRRL